MADSILGIDVGGTGIKGAPVNIETGELTGERFRVHTPQPATPTAVTASIAEVARNFKWQGSIGMGFPAVIKQGVAQTAANIDASWIGADAQHLVQKLTGCPTTVINDADAAGLAEMKFGAGKGNLGEVIMVTLGTGIGTAIFAGGRLVPNAELGHLTIRGKDAETRSSVAARDSHKWSYEKWGDHLTEFFNELERLFWPDLIIVGGGGSKEWSDLKPHIKTHTPMIPAEMLNLAGIIGAALAAEGVGSKQTVVGSIDEAVPRP